MLADTADLLSLSGHGALPVLDDAGDYVGIVTAQAVVEALAEQPDCAPAVVRQLAEPPTHVTADQPLAQALHVLLSAAGTGVPVLESARGKPVRWLSHQSALRAVCIAT
jgi:CIC family chloride channel protein